MSGFLQRGLSRTIGAAHNLGITERSVKFRATSWAFVVVQTQLQFETAKETNADSTINAMPVCTRYSSSANVARFSQAFVAH